MLGVRYRECRGEPRPTRLIEEREYQGEIVLILGQWDGLCLEEELNLRREVRDSRGGLAREDGQRPTHAPIPTEYLAVPVGVGQH